MILSPQAESVLRSLALFDAVGYPLSLSELTRFNRLGLTSGEISALLDTVPLQPLISRLNGMFCLAGSEDALSERPRRYRLALKKLRRARFFANLFSCFPWIRAIALYSSLALKNSSDSGDIDLLFITAGDRAWSARLFLNASLKIFRLRPTGKNSRDKICASYIIDENHLNLSCGAPELDGFLPFSAPTFVFLAGNQRVEAAFWRDNKPSCDKLPNWRPSRIERAPAPERHLFQIFLETAFGLIAEESYERWQRLILPQKYSQAEDGRRVDLSRGKIKLHDNDKRAGYYAAYLSAFNNLTDHEKQT